MKAFDLEFNDLVKQFEKDYRGYGRMDKEKDVAITKKGEFYQDGHINELFQAYMKGYALRDCIARLDEASK